MIWSHAGLHIVVCSLMLMAGGYLVYEAADEWFGNEAAGWTVGIKFVIGAGVLLLAMASLVVGFIGLSTLAKDMGLSS